MKAEIITIGDELLIGQVVDTNSAYLAQQLNKSGIDVFRITSVSDNHQEIISALAEASGRCSLVLVTGGLGPTKDDITKLALTDYFEDCLVQNDAVLAHVRRRMEERGIAMNDLNEKQAEVLSGCSVVHNELGTAPGMWMERDGVVYVFMPGVPHEMMGMFGDIILPRVQKHFSGEAICHRVLLVHGVPESHLSLMIESWELALPACIRLAYLPSLGLVRLRLTAHGKEKEPLLLILEEQISMIKPILGRHLVSEHAGTVEEAVGELLIRQEATLSLAESCTGGGIAHRITSVPGSSKYFLGSVVAYANEMKIRLLGVSRRSILKHGAVSAVVVEEMARGLRSRLKTDYAVATSGIAGPDGGTTEKPVGTVWIAVDSKWGTISKCYTFRDGRERVIDRSVTTALVMLMGEMNRCAG